MGNEAKARFSASLKNEVDNPLIKMQDYIDSCQNFLKISLKERDGIEAQKFTVQKIREQLMSAKSEQRAFSYSSELKNSWQDCVLILAKLLFICAMEDIDLATQKLDKLYKSNDLSDSMLIPEWDSRICLANGSLNKASEVIATRLIDDLKGENSYPKKLQLIYAIDDCFKKKYLDYISIKDRETLFNLALQTIFELQKNHFKFSHLHFVKAWSISNKTKPS
jgi:hypothetical protein